jgi:hypothetical protein
LSAELFEIAATDSAIGERLAAARRTAMQVLAEKLFDITDDKSGDVLETPRGPIPSSAAVGRSKLMFEARWKVMAAYNELFAEKRPSPVSVTINNHAERLEAARARATNRDKVITKQQMREAIDATFTEPASKVSADEQRARVTQAVEAAKPRSAAEQRAQAVAPNAEQLVEEERFGLDD